jgi:uncharacterized protein YigA (DUF484 family)
MTDTVLDDRLQASDVAAYLRRHPQFLSDYPELAALLTMPREQGAVSSLAVYQLKSLRDKNAELETRLAELVIEPGGAAAMPEFADLLGQQQPLAGRLSAERLQRLFGEQADQVRSAAVMPLDELGLLAIGSPDADHFQPGMGTLFLRMIAATVSAALLRAHQPG